MGIHRVRSYSVAPGEGKRLVPVQNWPAALKKSTEHP
jgi:hypothetical protein